MPKKKKSINIPLIIVLSILGFIYVIVFTVFTFGLVYIQLYGILRYFSINEPEIKRPENIIIESEEEFLLDFNTFKTTKSNNKLETNLTVINNTDNSNILDDNKYIFTDKFKEVIKDYENVKILKVISENEALVSGIKIDDNGRNDYIFSYHSETMQLSEPLLSFSLFDDYDGEGYSQGLIKICNKQDCLEFINTANDFYAPKIAKTGIFYSQKDKPARVVKNNIIYPYNVKFDVNSNFNNLNKVILSINDKNYSFDFTNGVLESIDKDKE